MIPRRSARWPAPTQREQMSILLPGRSLRQAPPGLPNTAIVATMVVGWIVDAEGACVRDMVTRNNSWTRAAAAWSCDAAQQLHFDACLTSKASYQYYQYRYIVRRHRRRRNDVAHAAFAVSASRYFLPSGSHTSGICAAPGSAGEQAEYSCW